MPSAVALANTHVDEALAQFSVRPPYESEFRGQRPWIDDCYAPDRVRDILHRLRRSKLDGAAAAADRIAELSPTALEVTFGALRAESDTSVEPSLRREFRVAPRLVLEHDALDGMHARAIDRDRAPTWAPNTPEAVSYADVDAYFALPGLRELDLDEVPPRA